MQPILFLTVGLPGAGKTTRAKEIEAEYEAIRLTKDEWVLKILGETASRTTADAISPRVEQALWQLALELLDYKNNVIIDFGLWAIEERKEFREVAERHGAKVYFVQCEASLEVLWERVRNREESKAGTLHIEYEEMKEWYERFEPLTDDEKRYVYELPS